MSEPNTCDRISKAIGMLFSCTPHGEYERIRTPYLYPDGDNIDLYIKKLHDVMTVTDLGETTRWLRMQTTSLRRSRKQKALIEDACLTHGVEFHKGMVVARSRSDEDIATVVTRVAQAALRISDLWFTFRTRSVQSMTDEVADFLSEKALSFERSEKLVGRSGRTWTVDFHVRAPARSSLVYVLATGSRSAARSIAEHVLAAWFDLNRLAAGPEALQFLSLFDDTVDVWSEEDFRLVEPLSTVLRWAEPGHLSAILHAA